MYFLELQTITVKRPTCYHQKTKTTQNQATQTQWPTTRNRCENNVWKNLKNTRIMKTSTNNSYKLTELIPTIFQIRVIKSEESRTVVRSTQIFLDKKKTRRQMRQSKKKLYVCAFMKLCTGFKIQPSSFLCICFNWLYIYLD